MKTLPKIPLFLPLATVLLSGTLLLPVYVASAQDKDTEKSDYGFWVDEHVSDPQKFDKDKFKEDNRDWVKDHLKKIKDGKVKFCKIVWNRHGPAKGHNWMFSCEGKCEDKEHVCEIQVIWNGTPEPATLEKFKFGAGEQGKNDQTVTAPGGLFKKNVFLVYCECKPKK